MGPHESRHLSAVPGTHEIVPERGTLRREFDGKPVDPPQAWDFPVLAVCRFCGKTARRKESLFADWTHVEAQEGEEG